MEEIQKMLLEELSNVKNGGDLKKADTISSLAAQYIYSVRIAVENKKLNTKVAKFNDDEKAFMDKDFSNIRNVKVM